MSYASKWFAGLCVVAISSLATGCSGATEPAPEELIDEGSAAAQAAPTVQWISEDGTNAYNLGSFSYGVAVDIGIWYTVAGVTNAQSTLTLTENANGVPATRVLQKPAANGKSGIREGYDVSDYKKGTNTFKYILRLMQGTKLMSTSTFTVTFVVTE